MANNIKYNQQYHMIDGELHTRRTVHTFSMGDIEELDLYVGSAVHEWFENDEKGQFIKKYGKDFVYHSMIEAHTFGHKIAITAMVPDRQWTIFQLKYSC